MFITLAQSEIEVFLGRYSNPNTQSQYRNSLAKFYSFLISHQIYSIDAVSLEVASLFKHELEANYSPKTAQLTTEVVREFIKFLNGRGLVSNNQFALLKSTQVNSREQKTPFVTSDEMLSMLRSTYKCTSHLTLSNRLMLILLFNLGIRESELTSLKLKDFKLQGSRYTVTILGKGSKFRYLTLSIPVTQEVEGLFLELGLNDEDHIIQGQEQGQPVNRSTIHRRIKKLAADAGLSKEVSPHSLRRGCATHLYQLHTPIEVISRILGHNSTAVTNKYIAKDVDMEMSGKYALEVTGKAI